MFLNAAILKKLMKIAYKDGGLTVARNDDRYYFAGRYWEMDCRIDQIPKTVGAQVFELTGEFPEEGERFKATKDGLQMEIGDSFVNSDDFDYGINVTDVILISKDDVEQRVLQAKDDKVYLLNDVYIAICDNNDVSQEEEYVVRPKYNPESGLLWENNVARFHAHWREDEKHEKLLEGLKHINLREALK